MLLTLPEHHPSCLRLWNLDRSLVDALNVAKLFLLTVDILNNLFPCQGTLPFPSFRNQTLKSHQHYPSNVTNCTKN